jgi:hypothetical protein
MSDYPKNNEIPSFYSKRIGVKERLAIDLMKDGNIYSTSKLIEFGIPRNTISTMREKGLISNIDWTYRGYYHLNEALRDPSLEAEYSPLLDELVAIQISGGPETVMCFYAAANYHGMGEDSRAVHHVAVPHKRGKPPHLTNFEILRFRNKSEFDFTIGVETVNHRGIDVKITNKSRTAIDMLRFSPKGGNIVKPQISIDLESAEKVLASCIDDSETSNDEIRSIAHNFGIGHIVDAIIGVDAHRTIPVFDAKNPEGDSEYPENETRLKQSL